MGEVWTHLAVRGNLRYLLYPQENQTMTRQFWEVSLCMRNLWRHCTRNVFRYSSSDAHSIQLQTANNCKTSLHWLYDCAVAVLIWRRSSGKGMHHHHNNVASPPQFYLNFINKPCSIHPILISYSVTSNYINILSNLWKNVLWAMPIFSRKYVVISMAGFVSVFK